MAVRPPFWPHWRPALWNPSYSDPACIELRGALAARFGVSPEVIVVGNGSEELIAAISRSILEVGAQVVTVVPSFGLHEIEPLAADATVLKVPMTAGAGFDLAALEAAISKGPRVVFLSSPWNPVGPSLDKPALQRLIEAVQPGTLFVLDEAYFEFAYDSQPDGVALLKESGIAHVVLGTFSKAYGLAGLRVGYAVCSDDYIARQIGAAKTPFSVNAAAQIAAIAALEDQTWMQASVARLVAERNRVAAALAGLGLSVAPSQTNFLFFDTRRDSSRLAADLLQDGIIVKAWREADFTTWLRATIGTPADNDRLIAALRKQVGG